MTQVKISLTEPKPILTSGGSLDFAAFDSLSGIAIIAPGEDTFGVALERGTNLALSTVSPSSVFGMNIDYSILTIAGRVPASAPIGATFPLTLDPTALHFFDPSGVAYPVETSPGQLTVDESVAIGNVSPGSEVVPAGGIVTITGNNFVPTTDIRFKEAKLSQVRFVSSTRIDVVMAQTATMHGMTVIAKNPDGTQATYFSYQRTRPMSLSSDPVMQFAVPLFPPKTTTAAAVSLPQPEAHVTYGVAVQNFDAARGAFATIELLDGQGNTIATAGESLDPSTFVVRELNELFGPAGSNARSVRVFSSAPIQVMGIAANQETGTASPIIANPNPPKASATVTFDAGTLSQTYTGTVKTVATTTSPAGLPVNVVFTGTPQNAGSYPVTATINDPNFTGSATGTLTINKASPTVAWSNPADIVYGTALSPLQLNATASVAGTFAYTPTAGVVLGAGPNQTLSVVFTPTDSNYETRTASVLINVAKATPIVSWPQPAGIVYGTAISATQMNSTSNVTGSFVYAPVAGTILDAGNQTLETTFTPADLANFEAVTSSVTLVVAKASQTITWANPADIVYGTPLTPAQLNAVVSVVGPAAGGAVIYSPASGTFLSAGNGQTLTVTAQATQNYEQASATATINVRRAPLSLTVDDQTKLYGSPLPTLTGTLTGVVNSDAITPFYSTTATMASPAGFYAITGQLSDRNGRLPNYDVTIAPATLAVARTPLVVKADDASKQYSDALPTFTASFSGFVLGETPAALGGVLTLQTTATRTAGPGIYPIVASGLTSPNYAISFAGGTLTVTPEDAAVAFLAPLTAAMSPYPATVTLAVTVQESPSQGEGPDTVGDIRNATMTFVDRLTGLTLCTAPIGLVASSTPGIGVASCSFSAPAGTYTIESRVGGWYARDDRADDVVVTVVIPNRDSVRGNGRATVTTAAGADPGSQLDFDVDAGYDKPAVKWAFTLTFHRTENGSLRTYQIDATSIGSLAVRPTTAGGIAWITGTTTLTDVTSKHSPVVVDDRATFLATFTDNGEPNPGDTIAVTLIGKNGGLLFSSQWNGTHTDDQAIGDGNIKVHVDK
jgi:hypothetical protein